MVEDSILTKPEGAKRLRRIPSDLLGVNCYAIGSVHTQYTSIPEDGARSGLKGSLERSEKGIERCFYLWG
jgi:hypothetical protein